MSSTSQAPSTPSVDRPFRVLIIGAGLAGSLLANGLLKHGVSVSVSERLAADSKREGYQITLGAPALEGFRACLTPEHIAALVARFGRSGGGKKSRAPVVYDSRFRPLLDLTRLPNYSKSAPINRVVLRDSLAEPIEAAGHLRYGRAFTHYEILGAGTKKERIRAHFENGELEDGDVLIATDGSHSRVNAQVGLNNIKQLTTHWSFIVKTDVSAKAVLRLPEQVLGKQALVFADGMTAYFSVYMPETSGVDEERQSNFEGSQISCMFAVALPVEWCPNGIEERSSQEKLDFIAGKMQRWAPEFHQMIDLVRGSDVYTYKPRVALRPKNDWRAKACVKGPVEGGHARVWLLGDACHAMLPNRGMGGNQAMRDTATALPLLVQLAENSKIERDQSAAIAASCDEFESEMLPRAFEWVQKSGGDSIVPIDSSTLLGKIFFLLAAQLVNVAAAWYYLLSIITQRTVVDDAPEFCD